MKNFYWVVSVVGIIFVGFMHGLLSLSQDHNKKIEHEQSTIKPITNTVHLTRVFKLNAIAKDANNIPVEITIIGQSVNYPNTTTIIKNAAHDYVSKMTTEEILQKHPDGTVRMAFYTHTML